MSEKCLFLKIDKKFVESVMDGGPDKKVPEEPTPISIALSEGSPVSSEEAGRDEAPEKKPTPISIVLPKASPVSRDDVLAANEARREEEERERLLKRAERFGIEKEKASQPKPGVTVPLTRKFRKNTAGGVFATGFDVFDDDEKVKKELRMHRFQTGKKAANESEGGKQEAAPEAEDWMVDEERRKARTAKFGEVKKRELPVEQETKVTKKKTKQARKWKLPRTDATESAVVRQDALYLHGCDSMSSNNVFGLFSLFGPSSMEWINDSSCTVSFADSFSAQRALHGMGELEKSENEETGENGWYSAKGGQSLRLATEGDVKAQFFNGQSAAERRLKEKRFGSALSKTAGKATRDKQGARVARRLVNNKVILLTSEESGDKERKRGTEHVSGEEAVLGENAVTPVVVLEPAVVVVDGSVVVPAMVSETCDSNDESGDSV